MKDFEFADLYDTYGALLTDLQRSLIEGYYLYDLSYTELAEEHGGSRQSVYDAIKKAKAQLTEYENKLSFLKIKTDLLTLAEDKSLDTRTLSEKITKIVRG